jgi:hypothetical protein
MARASPGEINRRDATPAPTGFAEIVSDDFPVPFHAGFCLFCSPHGNLHNDMNSLYDIKALAENWFKPLT